jgi:hypothetical protein
MYHIYANTYPVYPTRIVSDNAKMFIRGIPFTLPCETCANHAYAYIYNHIKWDPNLEFITSSREHMINFFIDFHNHVNYTLGKSLLTPVLAKRKWALI